jgi:hypothetical protein
MFARAGTGRHAQTPHLKKHLKLRLLRLNREGVLKAVKLFDSLKGFVGAVVERSAPNVHKLMSRQKMRERVEIPHPEVRACIQTFVYYTQQIPRSRSSTEHRLIPTKRISRCRVFVVYALNVFSSCALEVRDNETEYSPRFEYSIRFNERFINILPG